MGKIRPKNLEASCDRHHWLPTQHFPTSSLYGLGPQCTQLKVPSHNFMEGLSTGYLAKTPYPSRLGSKG